MPEAFEQLVDTLDRLERTTATSRTSSSRSRRDALPPADAHGKRTAAAALRVAVRDGRRGAHLARGGGRADRSRPARPAPAPDDRPEAKVEVARARPERVARRRLGGDRARRGHRRGAREGGRGRDPRALGDDAGRHPRPHPRRGRAHGARRDDVARGRRRARDGQALRRRLRGLSIDVAAGTVRSASTSCARAT